MRCDERSSLHVLAQSRKHDGNVNSDQTQARILNFENDVHCDGDNKPAAGNVAPAAGFADHAVARQARLLDEGPAGRY
jgi:hypothetical protein